MCWFSTLNAFPVIDGDISKFRVEDAETGRMVTTGNFKNFDSHFVPVKPIVEGSTNFIPCKQGEKAKYHELVVFETSQCLPRYLVDLIPISSSSTATTTETQKDVPAP